MSRTIPPNINERAFDCIIIGAGINGAGIAREAARRGLKVLLLDKGDMCAGTSAWSSRLIHGGLRYLEYAEIGLVRESLRERERLFKLAPHLIKPLPLLIPIYEGNIRGRLRIRAAMIAYDLLSFDKSLPHHQMFSREETINRAPGLEREGLRGAALYYDAQVEYAERLVVENVLSAQEHGAIILTYARVERIIADGNKARGVVFTDLIGGETFEAHAPLIVNVAGAWVDDVLAGARTEKETRVESENLIGGTKGSHIIVDVFPRAPRSALYSEAREDKRPFFIIPWNDLFLIGTTDVHYEGDLNQVEASEREIEYLIRETNRVIPSANLTRDKILYTYSGIRPLPFVKNRRASGITRRHFIHDHAPQIDGLISIIGGKLTTYRSLAEQTVNKIVQKTVPSSKSFNCGLRIADCGLEEDFLNPQSAIRNPQLKGAQIDDFDAFCVEFKKENRNLSEKTRAHLLRVYGTRANDVLKIAAASPESKEIFDSETGAIGAEVVFAFQNELAETLSDCLLRRTMVGLNSHAGLNAVEEAAHIAEKYLGWSTEKAAREVAAYREYVTRFHPRALSWVEVETRA